MEIKVGIGLDNIIFGMSQEDVVGTLGEPDKISKVEIEFGIVFYFNKLLIKTKFDRREDNKLYSIDVYNPEVLMYDQKIINKDKDEIIELLNINGHKEIKHEDYELFETVFCEDIWCTFMFEFNRLISIEFSPLSDNDKNIMWPLSNLTKAMIFNGYGPTEATCGVLYYNCEKIPDHIPIGHPISNT